jgi:hypothetical protein
MLTRWVTVRSVFSASSSSPQLWSPITFFSSVMVTTLPPPSSEISWKQPAQGGAWGDSWRLLPSLTAETNAWREMIWRRADRPVDCCMLLTASYAHTCGLTYAWRQLTIDVHQFVSRELALQDRLAFHSQHQPFGMHFELNIPPVKITCDGYIDEHVIHALRPRRGVSCSLQQPTLVEVLPRGMRQPWQSHRL